MLNLLTIALPAFVGAELEPTAPAGPPRPRSQREGMRWMSGATVMPAAARCPRRHKARKRDRVCELCGAEIPATSK